MTFPAVFTAATPLTPPPPTVKTHLTFPLLLPSLHPTNKKTTHLPSIKSAAAASDSTAIVDNPTSSKQETQIASQIGARVRVKKPLKVFHIPKVPEFDLNGKEGKIKQHVAVWKGKRISASLPYKVEFVEKLEGRGDAPVKFFAHLKEDEFEYVD